MADQDRNKAAAEFMETKTQEAINRMEDSKIAKSIPLEIERIPLRDITRYLLLFNVLNTIPVYLISAQAESKSKVVKWMKVIVKYGLTVTWILTAVVSGIAFFMELDSFVKFALFSAIAKLGIIGLALVLGSFPDTVPTVLSIVYALELAVLESLFLYYLAIYLHRLESDNYDSRGEAAKEKV
jgi:hypothetical protein